jgi:hypothetical protein
MYQPHTTRFSNLETLDIRLKLINGKSGFVVKDEQDLTKQNFTRATNANEV